MNKIALFTWCNTNANINYGQVLQCYSLYLYCKELGYDITVIKYRKITEKERLESPPSKGIEREKYEIKYKNCNYEDQQSSQVKKIERFIDDKFKITPLCYFKNEIIDEIKDKDILLVGSDQLWNPAWIDDVFLLDFDSKGKKCISYATSGIFSENEINHNKIQEIAQKILKFDYISVREKTSKTILSRYINKDICTVLDPVFLLDYNNWISLCSDIHISEPYVFAFFIGRIEPQKNLVKYVAKKYGAKRIIYLKMEISDEIINDLDIMEPYCDAGIEEFLSLIKDSVAVCTDSFHAFAFSLIFNKDFFLMDRAFVPKSDVSNDRWNWIMDVIGIKKRYANTRNEILNLGNIDYEDVNKNLDKYVKMSRDWLYNSLKVN